MAEVVATLALAQDNAFGQPLESQLRSCLLSSWLAQEADVGAQVRDDTYWVALLRYLGCTGHAHEVATLFGDEIAIRAQTLVHDAGNPAEVMRDVVAFATAGRTPEEREQIERSIAEGAHEWAVHNFSSGCEVGDMLARRLDVGPGVRESLAFTFERWSGTGFPDHVSGTDIPLAMRLVHVSHDMEAIGRLYSPEEAVDRCRERRDRTYDPELADIFVDNGADWFARLAKLDPWDAVLELEPAPHRTLAGAALDDALLVLADFIDLKSPFMNGHSRRCAELAGGAAATLGLADRTVTAVRRAALVHDLGTTAVPNSIWDKPGPLTRAEFDRVELHPMLTEQMLRRSPALAVLNPVAAAHHEKADGSGYHRGTAGIDPESGAGVMVAADIYVALTAERADRPAFSDEQAADELRRLVVEDVLDRASADAVLTEAGHAASPASERRPGFPGGLTGREVEVLREAAKGLTTKAIAERLFIAPKTVDAHIQHVYTKIGVSSRAAAALWAMQNGLMS
jgi:HD-GYP domain-containing protein (c-di-GMP phosphodiesterase class II)/DNA-binding CsgD family transcriptional regulator